MNSDNKDAIVLGTLKKEKSSKPIFVIFVFVFLIGTCLAFPYIKALIGDDFTLDDLLNKNNNNTTSPVVTTSTTTTTVSSSTSTTTSTTTVNNNSNILTCVYRNYEYIYTFDSVNNLIKIENNYTYTSADESLYNDTLLNYRIKSNKVNSLGGKSTIVQSDNNFKYTAIIDNDANFRDIDINYYLLNTKYDIISSELIKKGFDCK